MSEQIDWSKAPADAEYWCEMQFFKTVNGEWMVWCPGLGSWIDPAYKAPDNFSWWGNAVARPTTPSWSGEGLPPVGVVCEVKQMARGAEREWFKAKVLYSSHYTVVLDDYQAGEFVSHPCTLQFRPIRTPEQIESDARIKAAQEWLKSIGLEYGEDVADQCENILMAAEKKRMDKL